MKIQQRVQVSRRASGSELNEFSSRKSEKMSADRYNTAAWTQRMLYESRAERAEQTDWGYMVK